MKTPRIGEGEVLLRLGACGLCGTDVHKAVHQTVKPPIVLGHEVSGDIVEVGSGVTDFTVGDRVFVAHHIPCFTCHYCLHEHHTLCKQFRETNFDPGGFAEYIRIPALNVKHSMHKVPEKLSYEQAAMAEPVACCLRGIRLAKIQPGDSVLVMGAGQIGIIHSQLAKSFMAGKIMVSDISEFRLNKALELGANYAINVAREDLQERVMEITGGKGADTIIIAAGVSSLLTTAVNCVNRGGKIICFAPFDKNPNVSINARRFFEDEISIIGTYSSMSYEYGPVLNMIKEGVINVDAMITHSLKLENLQEAIQIASNPDEEYLKIIIKP
jgi:L-iditol 2-dehydrogenase